MGKIWHNLEHLCKSVRLNGVPRVPLCLGCSGGVGNVRANKVQNSRSASVFGYCLCLCRCRRRPRGPPELPVLNATHL